MKMLRGGVGLPVWPRSVRHWDISVESGWRAGRIRGPRPVGLSRCM